MVGPVLKLILVNRRINENLQTPELKTDQAWDTKGSKDQELDL